MCGFITWLKRVDRAYANAILQCKYIAGLFTKRMKDVMLELYMLSCFCCAIHMIPMTDKLPISFYSSIGLYQINNPPEINTTRLTKTELATPS